jgi:hypothetical protein
MALFLLKKSQQTKLLRQNQARDGVHFLRQAEEEAFELSAKRSGTPGVAKRRTAGYD